VKRRDDSILGERRDSLREDCTKFVSLTILVRPKMQKFQVVVVNAGIRGMAFLMDEPLPTGAVLALQHQIRIPGQSWIRSGKVTHATQHGEKWLIGCELTPPFSKEELESLQKPPSGA